MACVGLVASLYGDTVMCVADAAAGDPPFRSSYERGRPMPLLRGATSKVILADLPTRRLKQLIGRAPEFAGDDARDTFRKSLAFVRRQGYFVGRGEIDPGLAGGCSDDPTSSFCSCESDAEAEAAPTGAALQHAGGGHGTGGSAGVQAEQGCVSRDT